LLPKLLAPFSLLSGFVFFCFSILLLLIRISPFFLLPLVLRQFLLTFPDGASRMKTLALAPTPGIGWGYQIMMEFTLTFFLIFVIFSVAFDTVDSSLVEVKQLGLVRFCLLLFSFVA
jgi:hypothetical protein